MPSRRWVGPRQREGDTFGPVEPGYPLPAGARLGVVDRMLGVLGEAGTAGVQDGRLDLFLERWECRLEVETPPGTSGQVELVVRMTRWWLPRR